MFKRFISMVLTLCLICSVAVPSAFAACKHKDTTDKITVEAKCETTGLKDVVCNKCGETVQSDVVIPATGHKHDDVKTVAPTCETDGSIVKTCVNPGCSDVITEPGEKATGHNMSTTAEPDGEVVCGTPYDTVYKCLNEGCTHTELASHEENAHVAGDPKSVGKPVHGASVTFNVSCVNCDAVLNTYVVEEYHKFTKRVKAECKAPTCTEDGVEVKKCKECDAKESTVIPKLGHDLDTETEIFPEEIICGTDYDTVFQCTRCDYTEVANHVANPHKLASEAVTLETPVCGTPYDTYYLCTTEGCDYKEVAEHFENAHVPGDPQVVGKHKHGQPATFQVVCTKEGCGAVLDSYEVAEFHNFNKLVEHQDPTCAEEGFNVYKCNKCTETNKVMIEKLPHEIVLLKRVRATCTKSGLTAGQYCKNCDTATVEQKVIAALGHNPVVVPEESIEATCTSDGLTVAVCSRCGNKTSEFAAMTGHTSMTVPGTPATCTESGWTDGEKCETCGFIIKERDFIAAKDHSFVTDPAVEATCAAPGLSEGKHCEDCGFVQIAQYELPQLPHTAVEDPAIAATCTKAGKTAGSHCSVCDTIIVKQKKVPKLAHTPGEWEKQGIDMIQKCTECGLLLDSKPICEKHTWSNVKHDATCTENAFVVKTCTVCNFVKVVEKEYTATGHKMVTDAAVAPTCTSTGLSQGRHCENCDYVVPQVTVPAAGHNFKLVWLDGSLVYMCDRCFCIRAFIPGFILNIFKR